MRHATAQHLSHLGVREIAHLKQDECGALVLRQVVQILEQLTQVGALLDLIAKALGARLDALFGLLPSRAEHRHAAVAGDRVEPDLEPDLAVVTQQIPVGGGEGLLDGILGLLP